MIIQEDNEQQSLTCKLEHSECNEFLHNETYKLFEVIL